MSQFSLVKYVGMWANCTTFGILPLTVALNNELNCAA